MNSKFCKTLTTLLVALILLCGSVAMAQARYPVQSGTVTDDANALSQSAATDIANYAQTLTDETGVALHVVLVQFLDGEPVQAYADTLFARWALGQDDLLILGAAAEDSFALVSGTNVQAKLSNGSLTSLLYTSGFSDAFTTQQYDSAFGKLFVSFNDLVAKQYGKTIALHSWFGAYQPSAQATPAPTTIEDIATSVQNTMESVLGTVVDTTSSLWNSTMDSVADSVENYQNYRDQRDESGNGLTPGGWIVLVIIVMIVFGQSNPARRWRRGGCGCSPIGWLLGGFGLGSLLDRHNQQRRRDRW